MLWLLLPLRIPTPPECVCVRVCVCVCVCVRMCLLLSIAIPIYCSLFLWLPLTYQMSLTIPRLRHRRRSQNKLPKIRISENKRWWKKIENLQPSPECSPKCVTDDRVKCRDRKNWKKKLETLSFVFFTFVFALALSWVLGFVDSAAGENRIMWSCCVVGGVCVSLCVVPGVLGEFHRLTFGRWKNSSL